MLAYRIAALPPPPPLRSRVPLVRLHRVIELSTIPHLCVSSPGYTSVLGIPRRPVYDGHDSARLFFVTGET